MKSSTLGLGLVLGLIALTPPQLWANVTITSPTGGNNISADKALNSASGAAFTALGNIVIAEGVASDFGAGASQTLILTAPTGWQFNPGVGTVSFTSSRNITAAAIAVTASNATVTLTVNGTSALDTLTIGGLQVQIVDGANLAAADYIRRVFVNGGTAVIAGIDLDFTTFGLLNEVAGAAKAVAMQTQPGATATAGALFSPQPAVQVVDQFGNVLTLNNTTVVSASLAAGSGTLQGTLTAKAINGVAGYTNLSMNVAGTITIQFTATNLASVISAPTVVGPAPADHLVFATQPGSASAGVPFGIQPVIKTQDRFGSDSTVGLPASQLVTVTLSAGSGTLSGTMTLDIGTATGNGFVSFSNLQIDAAGTGKQLTASSSGLTSAVSASFGVSAALFSKLQLLLPGETAAPGTPTGKTGTPNPQAAGTPFNVTVNAVDANWNLVNTIVDTVGITATDTKATLPANAALVSGTKTFSVILNTVGSATLTATDLTDSSKSPNTSSSITVGGGTPNKLAIQIAPSATATAGIAFAQQPVIVVEDAGGNVVATDNGRVITVARGVGTAALQGTLTATTVNGQATFTNLSYNLAETITLNFTATGLTGMSSGNVVIGTGPFSKLQLLVPGETATPGTSTGKTGTPSAQVAGGAFPVTVNAVDAWWNLVNTVSDTAGLSSSDTTATLPPATAMAGGTTNLTVYFNAPGNFTLTVSDLTDGIKSSNISPAIAVAPAQFTPATGGGAIPADGAATGTFTALGGPSYSENASGNAGTGTIILKAPTGFVFDTGGTAPTVLITRLSGTTKNTANINGVASGTAMAMTSVTSTQLVFTVTIASSSGVTCKLTWQNVRVRPTAGTTLAVGSLTCTGTATLTGVSPASNLGTLREVAGAASSLAIQTQPSASATAGIAFAQQPVLQVRDRFGNLRSTANGVSDSTVVSAGRGAGSGTLQGTLNATATNGLATFINLSHNVATNITLAFSASGVTGTNSSVIVISPAAADHLVFATQPGSSTYGSALSPQPVLQTQDPFGNNSTVGLGASQMVSLALSSGTGTLQGTPAVDIGTGAGNGMATFSGLTVSMAGTGKQLSASGSGLSSALSSTFAVGQATLTGSITANNKVYDGTTAAAIASRNLSGALPGDDVSLSGGTAVFSSKTAGAAKTVTATGLSLSGTSAPNYQLASTSATTAADITVRALSVSAAGVNKAYDGTTSATATLSDNRVSGDSLTSSYTSASFADKNVGTAKPVSVSGISITGTDAANYSANTTASTTANVTGRSLSVSATGVNKVYDGTTDATVTLSDNRVAGDSLSTGYTSASFASKNAGTAKPVSVSGISITGTDSGNYTFNTTASTSANITARALAVSATGVNKVYDGGTAATVSLSDNRLSGDSLTGAYTSASFADKNVGTAKAVSVSGISLSGADAANYSPNTTTTATADITARSLSVSATGNNKIYDGTTAATVTLADNRVAGDSLSTNYTSATFADKNVGTAKTVSVSGISISGTDAANYSANTTASATANITAKGLTVSGIAANNKVYDATTSATINTAGAILSGVLNGDSVAVDTTSASGAFADKNAGTAKTVNVSAMSLSGTDAGNYSLIQPTATANITQAGLTVTADNKTRAAGQANPTLTASYSGFVGGETLATSGVSGSPALSTTTNNVAGTYPITAAVGTLSAANYSFSFVNGVLTVTPASASSLVIVSQPSSSATAGVPFAQQPAIAIRDAYGNLRTSDNGTVVTATRNSGSGTLQGILSTTAVNGVASFANLAHNVANTITLTFSGSGLTNVTSASIQVSPAAFTQLQLLVPGETAAPGTSTGKTGTASAQVASTGFPVTVNAVDAYWNLVNTVSDMVGLSSSDTTASLPPATAMAGGTTNLTVYFNATGNFTLTSNDLTDGTKNPGTSSSITVSPAQFTQATGGSAIPADGAATSTFTSLTGPSYSEKASGNVGTGTIILKAPAGFAFDTGGTAPTVKITGSGTASRNINAVSSGTSAAMSSVTSTQLIFTVTSTSNSGVTNTLTWQNVRVRPSAGTPMAAGNLARTGTASVVGLSTNANLGTLREVAGAASSLAMQTQPSASATAGIAFAQQPVLQVRDRFGNLRSSANGVVDSTVVSAARGAGSGTLQGTLNATATNGIASFTSLWHNVATNITLAFSASGVTGTNSSVIIISPAAADHLVFATQPGSSTYGSALSPQPVVQTQDPFGNNSTVGLAASQMVNLALSSGTGTLQGGTALDIGTAAGNGMVTFPGLTVSMAGAGKQLSASGSGLSSALSSTFAVGQATVTGSITANNKVYDGTTAAAIASRNLTGALPGDDVSLSGGTAVFSSKTAGAAKTVTVNGLSLTGTSAPNYQLASTSAATTADITVRALTVSAASVNKAYDGTTSATATLSDNRVSGDSLTSSYTSASFADKNVGTAKPVSVSGISISGIDAANYSANTTASTTANIAARSLSITATGNNKIYDGTTDATVTLSDNRVAGDSLSTSYTSASFANKNAGTAKTVSVSGITVTGTDSANYTANSTASATANITARALTVTATGNNKVYDGTTSATVSLADNRLAGDSLSISSTSASFADKNVSTAKAVSISGISLSGADAANYSPNTTATATADITARSLSVTATGNNKIYDGTTAATVTLADNRVAGDSLSTSYTSATFGDKNVATAKTVSVTGLSVTGTDAGNYTANTTTSTTANITPATVTALVSASNKVYDGTTAATIVTNSLNGVLGSDDLSLSGGTAVFGSKTAGLGKTVTISGLSLSGADAGNYQLASSTTTTTANIATRALTVSATGLNKVYNGTTNGTVTLADNRVAGDSLATTYTSASFADKNAGTAKPVNVSGISITGTDATNYSANPTASATADITARSLTLSATGANKVYDGTTNATVTLSDNRVAGDSLSTSYTSASFADKNVGTAKTVSVSGISVTGTDAGNYTANTTASATADITAKPLTVSGVSAADKVYDATTSATLSASSAALAGLVSGDTVTLNAASAAGAFANKNVGTGKTVTVSGLSLSGADAGNYSLSQPTVTASITRAGLTVTADNKTRAAGQSNPALTASYAGFVGGETLATSGVSGSPALSTTTNNVAGTYPISAAVGTLSAANYTFSFVNGVLTVTPASATTLVMLTQPASTATAGVPFAQQPAIAIQDAYGNLRSSDNSTVVTAARNAGSGTLQGTLSATAVNGVASFANLAHNVANTITLNFSGSGLTNATSASIQVSPAAFTQLQLLVPGETAAPGTSAGKTGTPSAQVASTGFPVTVNAVDAYWNLVNTVSDMVGLSSSDSTAALPPATAMAGGTTNLTVYFNATGNFTLTASDLTDGIKSYSTSPAIAVSPAQFTPATGGGAISADGAASGTFTALSGPSYSEQASANVGTGTIMLQAPAGFVFDAGGTAPAVLITRLSGTAKNTANLNGVASGTAVAMTSVTSTQLVFTVTSSSASSVTCKLTWQNVRVRPSAGTPLATGALRVSGTATLAGVLTNSNFGWFREVPGVASGLALQTQPSATATAGVAFAQQPVLQVRDQFGNLRSAINGTPDNTTVVTVSRNAGAGTLQGTLGATATNGLATFTNLSHNVATNISLAFSAPGLTGTNSSPIAVSAAAADRLVFMTQPGNGMAGAPLTTQPILLARDPYGNNSSAGLGASKIVTMTLTSGSGPLLGTATQDICSSAGNGVAAFTDLGVDSAGTDNQLTASAVGLSSAVSSPFSVAQNSQTITFGPMANRTYGDAPFIVSATASSGMSVNLSIVSGPATIAGNTVTITGVGAVTVRAAQGGNGYWAAAVPVDQSFTVTKATLTVTAQNSSRSYGTANPPLTASYAGFVNGENASVLSGSPSLSTTATIGSSVPGSPYPITAMQGTLNAANYNFVFVPGALTITKAMLSVAAVDQVRTYGTTNPPLSVSYSGFMNGDDASVLSGSPNLSTTATASSSVAGSPYPIAASLGTLSAVNYDFVFISGELTITPAASLTDVVSSANPSPTGSNVTFTATLSGVAPSIGVPTGTVQFMADGSPLGAPVSLDSGSASLTIGTLAHGIHTIAAQYAGDGNFFGSTNALGSNEVINLVPVTTVATYTRASNAGIQVSISDLLANFTSDADGDSLTLVSVGSGTNGATVLLSGNSIYYTPSDTNPNRNTTDHLDYAVTDGFPGGTVTNQIQILLDAPAPTPATLTGITVGAGSVILTFTGGPNSTYQVQRTTALEAGSMAWQGIGSATTDSTGHGQFTDTNPPSGRGFYRAVAGP